MLLKKVYQRLKIFVREDDVSVSLTSVDYQRTNHGVEFSNQFTSGQIATFPDTFSDLAEECLNILLRWGDEEFNPFPLLVFSYRLSEEIKALFDMRYDGFLRRELQTAISHELLHKRFDFLLQEFFRAPCYTKIIGISYEIDFRLYSRLGRLWKARGKEPL